MTSRVDGPLLPQMALADESDCEAVIRVTQILSFGPWGEVTVVVSFGLGRGRELSHADPAAGCLSEISLVAFCAAHGFERRQAPTYAVVWEPISPYMGIGSI